jgi:uncharacterized protein YecE (DUF72 family)
MVVRIGTSGWQYRDWRGPFYPAGLPQARWLEHYATAFDTVESNAAFYRLPERRTFEAWAARTPPDFTMAVKASRYLTHILRLREPEEAVDRLVERASGLGAKLGPVLVQLPPRFRADPARLDRTLARFPAGWRVAVEVRDPTWDADEIRAVLVEHGAALCLADRRGLLRPLWRTTDWAYLRFHEGTASPRPCYGDRALETWARRLCETWGPDADAWVYFNNDPRACAPANAVTFARACERLGMRVGRAREPLASSPGWDPRQVGEASP